MQWSTRFGETCKFVTLKIEVSIKLPFGYWQLKYVKYLTVYLNSFYSVTRSEHFQYSGNSFTSDHSSAKIICCFWLVDSVNNSEKL